MVSIALAQINPTIGDLPGNAALILRATHQAIGQGAQLVVFPELSLLGYPPRDLLLRPSFIAAAEETLYALAGKLPCSVFIGTAWLDAQDGRLRNGLVLVEAGRVKQRIAKRLLPNYEVFNEARYFTPGAWDNLVVTTKAGRFAVLICEDLLAAEDNYKLYGGRSPLQELKDVPPMALICAAASPYRSGHLARRHAAANKVARELNLPVCLVNQVGANDDLIFDGNSFAVGANGQVATQAAAFAEDMAIVEHSAMPPLGSIARPALDVVQERKAALVLGISDYFAKTGFKRALLGLSGGVDSALVASLAVEALGAANVHAITMPSPYTNAASLSDAATIATNLGIQLSTLPLAGALAQLTNLLGVASPNLVEENIQSRLRGLILMAQANAEGALVLACGNKSELAVGYATLYGDMCGALAPIGDLYKTEVWAMAATCPAIPVQVVSKPPSAELRPNQLDTDTLPPYDHLDEILRHLLQGTPPPAGMDEVLSARIANMVKCAEFKRRQAAIILKVSPQAFGTGWQYPVARKE